MGSSKLKTIKAASPGPQTSRTTPAGFRAWLQSEIDDIRFYYVRFRAEHGDAINEFRFGRMYETGQYGLHSEAQAYKWYLRAAYQGIAEAQAKVSDFHRNGRSVPRNDEEAFNWCRKAAEQGHPPSQAELGRLYQDGIGVSRNPVEARKWLAKTQSHPRPTPDRIPEPSVNNTFLPQRA